MRPRKLDETLSRHGRSARSDVQFILFAARLSLCEIQTLSKRTKSISRILGGLHSSRVGKESPKGRWGSNTPMSGDAHSIPTSEHDVSLIIITPHSADALIWMQNKEKAPLQGVTLTLSFGCRTRKRHPCKGLAYFSYVPRRKGAFDTVMRQMRASVEVGVFRPILLHQPIRQLI